MSWGAVAVAAVGAYSAWQSDRNAKKARKDAKDARERQEAIQQEQLDIARQERLEWEEAYGQVQDNLASFYNNLTVEDMEASGLQQQALAHQEAMDDLAANVAQRNIDGAAVDMLEQNLEIRNAENKAQIRHEAPFQVAQAQTGYLSSNITNPGTASMMNAYNMQSIAYGDQHAVSKQDEHRYLREKQQGYQIMGNAISQGFANSAYDKRYEQRRQDYIDERNMKYGVNNKGGNNG